jgi:formyltetrahydrofolate-dependent phosphoribosylglycinamide formyltransferase
MSPIKLAVLISGSGTTLQNFIDEIGMGRLDARIGPVIASRGGIGGIEKAERAGLAPHIVDRKEFDSVESFSERVFKLCDDAAVDLICMAGWLSLVKIPPRYAGRIMNVHPALLPGFGGKGMYGRHVHGAVIEAGCKVSGCTVHFVDDEYDHGPIILQRTCPVEEDDTPAILAHRVFEEEKLAYPHGIRLFQERRLVMQGRRVRVLDASEVAGEG